MSIHLQNQVSELRERVRVLEEAVHNLSKKRKPGRPANVANEQSRATSVIKPS